MNDDDFNNDFNAGLPDELAALAEQLTADAGMLSELYPARAPQFLPSVAAIGQSAAEQTCEPQDAFLRPMPVWMRWSAAAAVMVCAVWGAMGYVDDQPVAIELGRPRGDIVDSSSRKVGPTRTSLRPTPASSELYENLTAPAREALLDMWEAESVPQASLSI